MFAEAYMSTAQHLVDQYELQMPLPLYLKNYFRANRKFGSRDRRYISELVFSYYRLPPELKISSRERMLWGAVLGQRLPIVFFQKYISQNELPEAFSFNETYSLIEAKFGKQLWLHFPLSENVTEGKYLRYFFQPKSFFLRLRKNSDEILRILKENQIEFERIGNNSLRFKNHLELKEILPDDSSYVIQDIATQQCVDFFFPKDHEIWWECCAASGGKSLLVLDKNPRVDLYVSDLRESILHNLKERLSIYGYSISKKSYVMDVSTIKELPFKQPDVIICDVPCSGSGTWAQSPEQYYFFSEAKLQSYHNKQFEIAANVANFLQPGGKLFYITCSVFRKENEEVIERLISERKLILKSKQIIDASGLGGDFIFQAELSKAKE